MQTHSALGDLMIWWGLGLVILAGALYWWHRQTRTSDRSAATTREPAKPLGIAIMVVAAAVAIGTLVHVVRVGEAGTRAVWEGTVESTS